jgi:hypothetical protein
VVAPAATAQGTNEGGTGQDDSSGDSLWWRGDSRVAEGGRHDGTRCCGATAMVIVGNVVSYTISRGRRRVRYRGK